VALQLAERDPRLRAVRIDAHHAEVVLRAGGAPRIGLAEASGPFHLVFVARGRGGSQVVDAVAHGGRFGWAGPDVRALSSDPRAVALVSRSNAAMAAHDSYRVVDAEDGLKVGERAVVRSQRYEADTLRSRAGASRLVFIGDRSFRRDPGDACWTAGSDRPQSGAFDAFTVPETGLFLGYGPVIAQGDRLVVVQRAWQEDATLLTTTLAVDAPTGLLVSITYPHVSEELDWTPLAVPPAPAPICG
jgi:hypothetical protein